MQRFGRGLYLLAMLLFVQALLSSCGEISTTTPSPTTTVSSTATISTSGADGKWQEFTSKAGGYTVEIPGTVEEEDLSAEAGITSGTTHSEVDGVTYMVIYLDLPAESLALPENEYFRQMQEGVIANVESDSGATLETSDSVVINLEGYSGREFSFEASGQGSKVRAYLAEKRSYQVVVAGPSSVLSADTTTRFLDSFKLVK